MNPRCPVSPVSGMSGFLQMNSEQKSIRNDTFFSHLYSLAAQREVTCHLQKHSISSKSCYGAFLVSSVRVVKHQSEETVSGGLVQLLGWTHIGFFFIVFFHSNLLFAVCCRFLFALHLKGKVHPNIQHRLLTHMQLRSKTALQHSSTQLKQTTAHIKWPNAINTTNPSLWKSRHSKFILKRRLVMNQHM